MTCSSSEHRRSIHLKGYDYTLPGAYFVTLITQQRQCLFGDIENGSMQYSLLGQAAAGIWMNLPSHFDIHVDDWILMPNHLHGIIIINGRGKASGRLIGFSLRDQSPDALPLQDRLCGTHPGLLNAIIQNFKSISTRRINAARRTPGAPVWQRNYYEHIIWNENEWSQIQLYITHNPSQWELDTENPNFRDNIKL